MGDRDPSPGDASRPADPVRNPSPDGPRRRPPLGQLLLEHELVTPDQLARALEIHRATGERLGRVLLDMGIVDPEHVARLLSQQIGIPYVRLAGVGLAEDVLRLLPAPLASRLQAVPLEVRDGVLTVAMVDPLDVVAVDEIRRVTGMEVKVAVTTVRDFQAALNQYPALDVAQELVRDLPRPPAVDEERVSLEQLRRMAEEQPVVRLVNRLIEEAVRKRASDIHIEPQERHIRIRYRIDGVLLTRGTLPEYVHAQVVSRIKIMANMDIAERRVPQDGSFQTRVDGRPIDVRVSTIPAFYGEKAVLRLLDKSAPIYDLDKLGLSAANIARLRRIIRRPQGIFLLTGPTGSGKTTTLYAILNELNSEQVNIVTVEDPVEYQIAGITQMQVNPRAGVTFASALRHFLRQDPDIIMVGEIRDLETARIAVQAALTGHLVLSTLHTNDAPGAITRLLDMGIEPYLVASALEGVAAQRLVRVLCPKCREPDPVGAEEARARLGPQAPEGAFYLARGCDFCNYTGYRGRVAVFEVAEMDEDLRRLVVNRAPHHELKEQAVAAGMTTLLQDGLAKAAAGVTSLAEVWRVVHVEPANGPEDVADEDVPARTRRHAEG
ncbi:MAG: ATPase, T2SS/T4P/T4SS family [Armatimonadota bacterium]|nr:ATPase, T2SS/T4P/T4SS family [Armatimonadota bacterium]MDR7402475.1 ATPase, T2SS/T4P/T4SS family [Armatimonadota bacterium]MDR7437838.1 ATPase, T2SS/T4P/T4SS family [Armatimonadota bacterium]MDR7472098.1 ATPase, T2SS/T4P/T4SS family [Armatimonadota bacterium]MDR7507460.1 ATPase, T2SS/T4P/T4SS family [Armatimonadota bacterium]